jgi:hypothetical protein
MGATSGQIRRCVPTNLGEGEIPFHSFTCRPKAELQADAEHRNSNVSNIFACNYLKKHRSRAEKKLQPFVF